MSERTASAHRRGQFTGPHVAALEILSREGVLYRAEEVVHCWGEFDGMGRPVSYKCDIVISDPRYGAGVVEVEGRGTNSDDPRRDARLLKQFQWIEHIPNKDAWNVMAYLEKHRNKDIVLGGLP